MKARKCYSKLTWYATRLSQYKFDINGRNKTELLNGQFDGLARMLLDHRLLTFWDANLAGTWQPLIRIWCRTL